MKLNQLHPNEGQIPGVPGNPREITEDEFAKLKKSLKNFHKMLALRPIVVDEDFNILGGNMRYQALCKLAEEGATTEILNADGVIEGYYKFDQDIPEDWILQAKDLTPEEKMEFILKDNIERGKWDFDKLANEWDPDMIKEWDVDAAQWNTIPSDDDLESLFEDTQHEKEKTTKIVIEVPTQHEDVIGDIKEAVKITLEEWSGCEVR